MKMNTHTVICSAAMNILWFLQVWLEVRVLRIPQWVIPLLYVVDTCTVDTLSLSSLSKVKLVICSSGGKKKESVLWQCIGATWEVWGASLNLAESQLDGWEGDSSGFSEQRPSIPRWTEREASPSKVWKRLNTAHWHKGWEGASRWHCSTLIQGGRNLEVWSRSTQPKHPGAGERLQILENSEWALFFWAWM